MLGGDLSKSCVGIINGKKVVNFGDKNERFLCKDNSTCVNLTNSLKYEGGPFYCEDVGNPWDGLLSYDNILISILNVFITITLEEWMT